MKVTIHQTVIKTEILNYHLIDLPNLHGMRIDSFEITAKEWWLARKYHGAEKINKYLHTQLFNTLKANSDG